MFSSFDIWKMAAGVAFFLLAMNFMESSLRQLAGRRFKLILKKQTDSKIKAIGGGAIVTGLLQSSSIANLLVLSMVGSGVVKMENALALMLGSNLGTTFNSWIVAVFGFTFNIENYALPVAGIAGIFMAFISNESKPFLWFKFLFSLAFLFIALGFIKSGMEEFVKQTDLSGFSKYPSLVFLLAGIVLTGIVQSSSATMALALSALHANAITLYMATAIALGAEIGTTFKLFLASAGGAAVKKRVALGNFLFNLVTVFVVFLLLKPVNYLISEMLPAGNNLIALVVFQSFVNLFCIIMFFPFLKFLGRFLRRRFSGAEEESSYISAVSVADPESALQALEKETGAFLNYVIEYSLDTFDLKENVVADHSMHKSFHRKSITEKYDYIKQLHGEMHGYYLKLLNTAKDKPETERLEQLSSAIRNTMYAAKNIRDAQHDIRQMRNSSNDIKYSFYIQSKQKLLDFYRRISQMMNNNAGTDNFKELTSFYQSVTAGYSETLKLLYKENLANRVSEVEISTLINFNRELYTSFKSLLFGLKDYLLTTEEADYFDGLPGFIR
jgi:phosphate:Na+ symporter